MPPDRDSLLAGRRREPLEDDEVRKVSNIVRGLDATVDAIHTPGKATCFRVLRDVTTGENYGQIAFGPDVYPGKGVDANSSLSMKAAIAHELCHYYRNADKRELQDDELIEIDEAMTSLEAALRFPKDITDHDMRTLVGDALTRLRRFVAAFEERKASATSPNESQ